ncbi:MAG: YggT family protein [Chloroflexi bacterium]|nr:YggT family protein [Chloroflexota bacterium]
MNFVRFLVVALEALILARVLLSWTDPTGRGRLASFVTSMTEPILAPVRRLMPRTGMLDWSPFIVILVLGMILRAVTS